VIYQVIAGLLAELHLLMTIDLLTQSIDVRDI